MFCSSLALCFIFRLASFNNQVVQSLSSLFELSLCLSMNLGELHGMLNLVLLESLGGFFVLLLILTLALGFLIWWSLGFGFCCSLCRRFPLPLSAVALRRGLVVGVDDGFMYWWCVVDWWRRLVLPMCIGESEALQDCVLRRHSPVDC